jgi:hypothetical protein
MGEDKEWNPTVTRGKKLARSGAQKGSPGLLSSLPRDAFKSLRFGLRYLSELLNRISAESNPFLKVSNKLKNSMQAHEVKGKGKFILCLTEPLKTEFLLSNIYKFSAYLSGNTSPLQSPTG